MTSIHPSIMQRRKWQQADRILNCAANLIDWLEADLKPHAQILVKLWKQALKPR